LFAVRFGGKLINTANGRMQTHTWDERQNTIWACSMILILHDLDIEFLMINLVRTITRLLVSSEAFYILVCHKIQENDQTKKNKWTRKHIVLSGKCRFACFFFFLLQKPDSIDWKVYMYILMQHAQPFYPKNELSSLFL